MNTDMSVEAVHATCASDPEQARAWNLEGERRSKLYPDPCEYDPESKRAAFSFELHARAEWLVGADGKWRLCGQCAALPEFRRLRKRTFIVRKKFKFGGGP